MNLWTKAKIGTAYISSSTHAVSVDSASMLTSKFQLKFYQFCYPDKDKEYYESSQTGNLKLDIFLLLGNFFRRKLKDIGRID